MDKDFSQDFGPFEGRVWLNCAHQGPLPRVAVNAAQEALEWKTAPHRLADEAFDQVPQRLKRALAELLGALAEDIILANSTSYGLHLVANGFPWKAGDEVLAVEGDFPATLLPWVRLQSRGVRLRLLKSPSGALGAEDLRAQVTGSTRVFCVSWVNSFTGVAEDIHALGAVCRAHNVMFVVNGSQAVGARRLDVSSAPVDAVSTCGFKWLCGPYATGFCWIRRELRERLECPQTYWLAQQAGRPLNSMRELTLRADLGTAAYDVFCPANFLNFLPWTAAVEYLLGQGSEAIERHNERLVSSLIQGLDAKPYTLLSPREGAARSSLVVMSHRDRERNPQIHQALRAQGVDIALREGNLRLSPHLYNTHTDIDRAVSILQANG